MTGSDNLRLARHDRLAEEDEHWLPKPVMVTSVSLILTGKLKFKVEVLRIKVISGLRQKVKFLHGICFTFF